MFTQCPECGTAFRITAEVLKQAAGKVRCGGCGIAFNALDYLSEKKPAATPAPPTDGSVPELTPDSAELEPVEPPKTISAVQSAALLKTLDELAGSDIRIEDTGVEWRVLDEDEEEVADELKDIDVAKELEDTGSMKWFIDETPTPVDEHLSAEPGEMDAPELFEEPAHSGGGDEMRFDDDTPLPDDFDFDHEPSAEPAPVVESRDAPSDVEAAQVDLALGDPEGWEDLLGEVDEEDIDEDPDEAIPGNVDDDVVEEAIPDVDEQFATQAEAMGIDLSGIHARAEEETSAEDPLEDTSIDEDLIAAAFEVEAAAKVPQDETPDPGLEDEPDLVVEPELEIEPELEDEPKLEVEPEEDDDIEFELDFDDEDLTEAKDRELVTSTAEDAQLEAELGLDAQADEDEPEKPKPLILPQSADEQTVNMMIDQDLLALAVDDEEGFASTIVQKQSGDEVLAQDDVPQDDEPADDEPAAEAAAEVAGDNPLVETIIMEGEFIRDADEEEKLEEARKKNRRSEPEVGIGHANRGTGEGRRTRAEGADQLRPGRRDCRPGVAAPVAGAAPVPGSVGDVSGL